jgi:uncharacterized iron-regulated membrane protein
MTLRRRLLRIARKLHIWVGLTAALYFMLIAATGVAINHRERLRLEERTVSRTWLPASYRPDDGPEVRADIVVTDLHSGLIFGRVGAPILDFVALVWFISIATGVTMLVVRRSMHYSQSKRVYRDGPPTSAQPSPPSRKPETVAAATTGDRN